MPKKKSTASSPRIVALKNRYRLDEALPGNDLVDEERARLAGPDRDATILLQHPFAD